MLLVRLRRRSGVAADGPTPKDAVLWFGRRRKRSQEDAVNRLAVILALSLLATAAHAQTRPSTVNRPCVASQQLVFARGAVVLGTGGYTYDRFVRDRNFCEFNQYLEPGFVPSLDTPQCFVGYRCKDGPNDLFWDE
jgi:hypothetical protein